ncbi:MAG TPA: winged helix DNA-binding domain-containing protein [Terriglobales bacterium]|nr:winged helix DNA-binding domain-containing protein [Terriglobales bacterium]
MKSSKTPPLAPAQIHSLRLHRHHLLDREPAGAVTLCRDVCGVQAQLTQAAYLQLWARNHSLSRTQIEECLWKQRSLVKTSLMRQTLHVIPAEEFSIYIPALKRSRVNAAFSVMKRCKISREEADELTAHILESLAAGPLNRTAIRAAVRPKVSKRVRSWMDKVWSILRFPVAEGLVCYGPGEGNQVTFIRSDQWLPRQKMLNEQSAKSELLRRYLRAYGPATWKDFAHWSGLPMVEVRELPPLVENELEDLGGLMLLREDVKALEDIPADAGSVHLLPHFDVYLLAHATKEHFLNPAQYKRVYRNQGWISPVLLIGGEIAGVWRYDFAGKKVLVTIEAFRPLSKRLRQQVGEKAEALAKFFGRTLEFRTSPLG